MVVFDEYFLNLITGVVILGSVTSATMSARRRARVPQSARATSIEKSEDSQSDGAEEVSICLDLKTQRCSVDLRCLIMHALVS